ncbi:N-carbamoyl-D-amino-acid hydrolase [Bradyrhizobium prioriisuperbiae]|uniref:N-carbamoyl-D-amino-acid hydrolase n=1 Tax=Bradyrhizobium prioriisuperbiae TaxID=2854389 RepID=UPI0028E36CC5|nr:N-carbamoyl-D-amino-acid hydrolase [Bradyrhizobium prioritasuperba]
MTRIVRVAGAQMGPNQRGDRREDILARMIRLLEQAADRGASLVVFPELAFTTFFPRWLLSDDELTHYFERSMPNPAVAPLFTRARELGVGFYVGYAELTPEGQRFNSSMLVAPDGAVVGNYRKVHLPGSEQPRPDSHFQQLEKRYFAYGDLGFQAFRGPKAWQRGIFGMLICNDRRWPEAWRELGLQSMELLCVGYNSAGYDPNGGSSEDATLRTFHAKLAIQANAYMNATFAVAVAKAGNEDGSALIGGSCIVDPNGLILTEATSLDDELIVADCDLDQCLQGKSKMFNFAAHRRPQHYGRITAQVGAIAPA